jgi:peptide/nickel transport system substrate-binding protein
MTQLATLRPWAAMAAAVIGLVAAGCGGEDETGGSGKPQTIIRGTTDQPVSYDPAGAYDLPSYDVIYNVYQNLLTIPAGGSKPEPEAAESCDFTDDTTYKCTLKSGLKFSDGSDLTSEDVKFSFERNIKIADPNGASSLLANMKRVSAPDPQTVEFKLKAPDATFPFVLTVGSFAIVPSDVFPADKLQPSDKVVGSGRYKVSSYKPGQQTVLETNTQYKGPSPATDSRAIVQYFDKASALKLAVQQGDVDIAYRSLSPTDIGSLRDADGVSIVEGNGTEIRYLAFNLNLQPGGSPEGKKAVRRAVAQTIDRGAIAENVYDGTVDPLYSMVPQGLQFATKPFADRYGEASDVDAARKTLSDAGVKTPVPLEIWWTPSHYGPSSGDEYAEIKNQLDGSGLFKVKLKSTEWTQYSEAAFTDKYPQFELGWFPDYPDAHDYAASFYAKDTFINNHYDSKEMNSLLAKEAASDDPGVRGDAFVKIQELGAEDVPTIPIWQGKQVAAVRDGVEGVQDTFDPSFIFRFWVISKK